jgi:hypothetical protein
VLLEAEGVAFDESGTVDWERFGWAGLSWPEIKALLTDREEESHG